MKKRSAFILIFVLFLSICGCGKHDVAHLDMENYGADFQAENENLFPNASCEHIEIYMDATKILSAEEARFYHLCACKYGNCDYEEYLAPHVIRFDINWQYTGYPAYAENGYLYHTLFKQCAECGMSLTIKIYCEKQNANCGRGEDMYPECIAADRDWHEIFKDYPYRIEIN